MHNYAKAHPKADRNGKAQPKADRNEKAQPKAERHETERRFTYILLAL
jgi:hypothetical protein